MIRYLNQEVEILILPQSVEWRRDSREPGNREINIFNSLSQATILGLP